MVKSETRRDAEILVRNPSPRLFGKKFRDSKKVNTNHAKTRLRDLSKTLPRFRDPAKIFRDPRFSRYHSPPLNWLPTLNLIPLSTACRLELSFYFIPKTNQRVGNRKLGKFFPSVILELITLQFSIVSFNNFDL